MIYIMRYDRFGLNALDLSQHTSVSITPVTPAVFDEVLSNNRVPVLVPGDGTTLKPGDTLYVGKCPDSKEAPWLKITISNAESMAKALDSSEEPLIAESDLGESILS